MYYPSVYATESGFKNLPPRSVQKLPVVICQFLIQSKFFLKTKHKIIHIHFLFTFFFFFLHQTILWFWVQYFWIFFFSPPHFSSVHHTFQLNIDLIRFIVLSIASRCFFIFFSGLATQTAANFKLAFDILTILYLSA